MRAINELGMLAELYERDERCRRRGSMRKRLTSLCAVVLLSACAPVVDVYKMGNEYIQDAHSRNFWAPNWQRVTYCWKLQDGYCPKEDTRVETASSIAMDSPARSAAAGFAANVPLGLGIGLGLAYQNVGRMTQSVTGNQAVKTNFESPYGVIK